jgi:hypothetical protein
MRSRRAGDGFVFCYLFLQFNLQGYAGKFADLTVAIWDMCYEFDPVLLTQNTTFLFKIGFQLVYDCALSNSFQFINHHKI